MNKLFCTFCTLDDLEVTLETINKKYDILNQKIFVLELKDSNEYVCTYNIDTFNTNSLLPGTITAHRIRRVNVIYSLNSLNYLIKKLNNGIHDPSYKINWDNYKNSILLTQNNEFKQLGTKLYKVISL